MLVEVGEYRTAHVFSNDRFFCWCALWCYLIRFICLFIGENVTSVIREIRVGHLLKRVWLFLIYF